MTSQILQCLLDPSSAYRAFINNNFSKKKQLERLREVLSYVKISPDQHLSLTSLKQKQLVLFPEKHDGRFTPNYSEIVRLLWTRKSTLLIEHCRIAHRGQLACIGEDDEIFEKTESWQLVDDPDLKAIEHLLSRNGELLLRLKKIILFDRKKIDLSDSISFYDECLAFLSDLDTFQKIEPLVFSKLRALHEHYLAENIYVCRQQLMMHVMLQVIPLVMKCTLATSSASQKIKEKREQYLFRMIIEKIRTCDKVFVVLGKNHLKKEPTTEFSLFHQITEEKIPFVILRPKKACPTETAPLSLREQIHSTTAEINAWDAEFFCESAHIYAGNLVILEFIKLMHMKYKHELATQRLH